MHYFDHSATAKTLKEAAGAACAMMTEDYGNPSSSHAMGICAEKAVEESRKELAAALGAKPKELYFTSGGTESINTAIFGAVQRNRRLGNHIVTSQIEHSATLACAKRLQAEGYEVTFLPPEKNGGVSAAAVEDALRADTILVSLMLVNNETGAVLPLEQIGKMLQKKPALFHIDGVQALFKMPCLPKRYGADFMSFSGHKIGAPKGIGALYIRDGVQIRPYLVGGGQERGFRSGTENTPGIAGFGAACRVRRASMEQDIQTVAALRRELEQRLMAEFPFAKINGSSGIPHVLNVSLEGCKSEVMLRVLEGDGVYVSAGSACAKGHESHVLAAMGLSNGRIDSALRISLASSNTKEDIEALIQAMRKGVAMLRR